MKSKYAFILFIMTITNSLFGQKTDFVIEGKVTFMTSKNVYVKFESTKKIKVGDSLWVSNISTPCLLVKNKSSNSVVCSIINDCVINKDDIIIYNYVIIPEKTETIEEEIIPVVDSTLSNNLNKKEVSYLENIKARLSVASYSYLSNIRDDRHSLMTRFSFTGNHINNSKFSVETYLNYRKNFISGDRSNTVKSSFFNVYNLAIKYDIDTTFSVTAGRKINYKTSSLGAIDGLQAEKYFGKNYVGVLVGFRPDFIDYGFNSDLFQYGAYIGRQTESKNFYSQTTLGFIEQTNSGETDRRYVYFQHSSRLFSKLNLFSSMELDIYSKVDDVETNDVRLTNLYVSARYRFSRKVNLSLSYDSRKRIIYYETLQSIIERLLDEDLARQGLRARINVRPWKNISTGLSYSKRFQNDTENKSDNIYAYLNLSKVPRIGGRVTVSYNMNSSNYLDSNIASIRYSRPFFDQRLNADIYYRFVNYEYVRNIPNFSQNYFGAYLSYYLDRTLTISLSGEYSSYDLENNYRINTRIIKRFYRKRKK